MIIFKHIFPVNNQPTTDNCPSDQTIPANLGVTTATATWVEPIFLDESGIITPTSNYKPGDTFSLGTTVVSYTATDLTGAQGTCLFSITVEGKYYTKYLIDVNIHRCAIYKIVT